MMPSVMMAPVMTPPMPVVADAAWPVMGPDDAAATVGIVVARRINRRVVAAVAVEMTAVMVEVRPVGVVRAIMIAAAMEHRPRTESAVECRATTVEGRTRATTAEGMSSPMKRGTAAATPEHGAAAMERRATASAVERRTAVEAATAPTVESTTAGMPAATATGASDLNGQHVRRCLRGGAGTGTHRRHRKRRPSGRARQDKQCGRRKTEATSKTSTLVLHPHHGPFSLNAVQRWTHAAPMLVVRSVDSRTPIMNVEIAT